MDFSNLGLGLVLRLINQCLDESIVGIGLFGGIGLFVGIVLAIVAKRAGWFTRNNAFRPVGFIYPIYIPLLFGISASAVGGTWYAQDEFIREVPGTITPNMRDGFVGFQRFVRMSWSDIERQQIPFSALVGHFTDGISYDPPEDIEDWSMDFKIDMANEYGPRTARWGLECVVHNMMLRENSATGISALSEDEYERAAVILAHEKDVLDYEDDFWAEVDAAITTRINDHFSGVYLRLLGVFALLLLLPVIETIFNLRRKA